MFIISRFYATFELIFYSILRLYLLIFLFAFLVFNTNERIYAQKLNVKWIAFEKKNQPILDSLKYERKIFRKNISKQVTDLFNQLKVKGYFTPKLISSKVKKTEFEAIIKLGEKTNKLIIQLSKEQLTLLERKNPKEFIDIQKVSDYKNSVRNILLKKGIPFSNIVFTNYRFKNSNLLVNLSIEKSKVRIIDKVIFKGYEDFPKSFKEHYLKIDSNSVFTPALLKVIEDKINRLSFAKSTKTPEVLFKQDSTIIYIYSKKKNNNNIDALINLNTNESNSLQFNGIIDLTLDNILNSGEKIRVFWNRVDENQSEFKLESNIPYILNTKINSNFAFHIYRQDSTFLNTTAQFKLSYELNYKTNLGLNFGLVSSTEIENQQVTGNIADYNSFLFSGFIELKSKKNSFNGSPKTYQQYGTGLKLRTSDVEDTGQVEIKTKITANLELSERSLIYLSNTTQLLFSENYLINELYRIGGINSLRGFNEQSIFASKYSIINTEYRYYGNENNYLYTISDFSWIENINSKGDFFYNLGLGYSFRKSNNQINLAYVLGGVSNSRLDFNNSRLIVKFVTFF